MKYSLKKARAIADAFATAEHKVADVCKQFEISESTFYAWKADNPEFSELLKKAEELRRQALGEMARSGLALLLGKQEVEETTIEFIPDKKDKAKRTVKLQKVTKRVVMPNATAVIFALKNLDADNFKDKHEVEHSGEMGVTWNETKTYAAPADDSHA
ncbi:hypothetical protein Q5H92_08890 [Hymenobacter sp. M29]|uniref:Homeodomain phBC6A51-type domain-containing protein n=1 Tax=Hymenobacter mellowenesis TaxID=3063995 RepID=A0ABT9ABU9_9BACT|nr:transposase [Hymenobacter sp. M29]MDO7846471.1 hypothetical protein [Hymenobacter sp. M29]